MAPGPSDERSSDEAFIASVADGDKAALAALCDRHAGLMLAVGMRMLAERREAEDVLHDVFLEIWRSAGQFDVERGSGRSWMLVRMRSRCLDRLRTRAWRKPPPSLLPRAPRSGGP